MPLHLLNGEVDPTASFREKIAELEGHLAQSDDTISDLRAQLASAIRSQAPLRKLLAPWKHAIDNVFGLVDVGVVDESGTTSNMAQMSKWDAIKKRLTGKDVEVIDLLLTQGAMTVSNIANAIHCSGEAARQRVDKLRGQGLLVKNGRDVTLKP